MPERDFLRGKALALLGAAVACLPPLSLLFGLNRVFGPDWFNHLWLMEYAGAWFRAHRDLADAFNTPDIIGLTTPLFYGSKFYSCGGILASVGGSGLAMRVIILGALVLQYLQVERAARVAGAPRILGQVLSISLCWAIYPLNNLYVRAAVAEFVAWLFLTSAAASAFVLLSRTLQGVQTRYDRLAAGLFYSLAALTHPLTAAFGALSLAILAGAFVWLLKERTVRSAAVWNALAILAVLGPWLFVVTLFRKQVPVANPHMVEAGFRQQGFFPATIDNIWTRLSPIPVSFPDATHAPGLDTQIFMPGCLLLLLLVCLGFLFKVRGQSKTAKFFLRLACCEVALAGFFLLVSCQPGLSGLFRGIFDVLQFPYRLVSYVNVSLLLAILFFAAAIDWPLVRSRPRIRAGSTAFLVLALGLAGWGLFAELSHAGSTSAIVSEDGSVMPPPQKFRSNREANWAPRAWTSASNPIELPNTEYGELDYTVNRGMRDAADFRLLPELNVALPVSGESEFGLVGTIRLTVNQRTLVKTNVQAFPWNRVKIDGLPVLRSELVAVDREELPSWVRQPFTGVVLPPGEHLLGYEFAPNPVWRVLNILSWLALVVWAALAINAAIRPNNR